MMNGLFEMDSYLFFLNFCCIYVWADAIPDLSEHYETAVKEASRLGRLSAKLRFESVTENSTDV